MKKPSDEEVDEEIGREIAAGTLANNWKPARVKTGSNPRIVHGVRLSAEEAKLFGEAATARGMTLSEFLRSSAYAALENGPSAGQAATLASVREKLRELNEIVSRG